MYKITNMENETIQPEIKEEAKSKLPKDRNNIWIGLFLLLIGSVLLAKQMGVFFPAWLFSWHFFLIVLGLLIGIRHGFRHPLWIILILAGGFFLAEDYYPALAIRQYAWPLGIIVVGIFFLFRPRNRNRKIWWEQLEKQHARAKNYHERREQREKYRRAFSTGYTSGEDYIDVVSVLGGIKKNILSKNFRGGESISFLGGTELNLSQADINGRVVLELTQVLGGTKLIIPSHWDVKSELITVFGSIDDKRSVENVNIDPNKVLVLRGTSVLGGIDIRSY